MTSQVGFPPGFTDIQDIADRFSELGQIQLLLALDDIWTTYLSQARLGEVPDPDFEVLSISLTA